MELKQLRYALAVAEELHFGRAAEREHVAQSALSDQIGRLERELGTVLFERTTRSIRLTDSGRAFVEEARRTLRQLAGAAGLAARVGGEERGILRVGFIAGVGEFVHDALLAYRERAPGIGLQAQELRMDQVRSLGLVDSQVDLAVVLTVRSALPLPFPHQVLWVEPCVLAVPRDHPFAGRERVDHSELDPAELLFGEDDLFDWPASRPGLPRTCGERLEYVASGLGVCLMEISHLAYEQRPGVVHVPLDGGPEVVAVLVWRDRGRPEVAEFVTVARALARRRPDRR